MFIKNNVYKKFENEIDEIIHGEVGTMNEYVPDEGEYDYDEDAEYDEDNTYRGLTVDDN